MIGLAVGPDGSLYTSTGSLNTFNAYMLAGTDGTPPKPADRGKPGLLSHYSLKQESGTVLRFAPGADRPEIEATGVSYLTAMRFNRQGDLFATDPEGATWVPNGNPFDEFIQIQAGRHYGFPRPGTRSTCPPARSTSRASSTSPRSTSRPAGSSSTTGRPPGGRSSGRVTWS